MRRHIIALAAAACLSATACSPGPSTETASPTPADVVTSATMDSPEPTMDSPEPTTSETATKTTTPEASPSASVSATPSISPSPSASASGKATAEIVDLATQTFAVSPQDAMETAVEKSGGGFVYSIELDWSRYHNAWVYELDVLMGTMDHDVDINADTGEVLELDRDETDDVEQAVSLDSPMSWATARDKALDAVQGKITGWKLEYDDDYTAYEFEIEDSSGDDIEVEINVATGKIKIDD